MQPPGLHQAVILCRSVRAFRPSGMQWFQLHAASALRDKFAWPRGGRSIELRAKTWNSEVISSRPAIAFGVFAVPGGPFSGRVASRPVTHSDSVAFSVFSVGGEQAGEGERGFCGGDEG